MKKRLEAYTNGLEDIRPLNEAKAASSTDYPEETVTKPYFFSTGDLTSTSPTKNDIEEEKLMAVTEILSTVITEYTTAVSEIEDTLSVPYHLSIDRQDSDKTFHESQLKTSVDNDADIESVSEKVKMRVISNGSELFKDTNGENILMQVNTVDNNYHENETLTDRFQEETSVITTSSPLTGDLRQTVERSVEEKTTNSFLIKKDEYEESFKSSSRFDENVVENTFSKEVFPVTTGYLTTTTEAFYSPELGSELAADSAPSTSSNTFSKESLEGTYFSADSNEQNYFKDKNEVTIVNQESFATNANYVSSLSTAPALERVDSLSPHALTRSTEPPNKKVNVTPSSEVAVSNDQENKLSNSHSRHGHVLPPDSPVLSINNAKPKGDEDELNTEQVSTRASLFPWWLFLVMGILVVSIIAIAGYSFSKAR